MFNGISLSEKERNLLKNVSNFTEFKKKYDEFNKVFPIFNNKYTLLHYACDFGTYDVVKYLLKKEYPLNIINKYGNSELLICVKKEKIDIVEELIKNNADINLIDKNGDNAFSFAFKKFYKKINTKNTKNTKVYEKIVEILINKDPNLEIGDLDINDVLKFANKFKHKVFLTNILIKINSLFLATEYNNINSVTKLINNININSFNNNFTSLMIASKKGFIDLVNFFINKSANIDLCNKNGETALMISIINNRFEVFKLLIDSGSNVNIQSKNGNTALMYACELGLIEMVILLIERCSDINIFNKNGETALMISIINNRFEVFKLLIDSGSNVNIQSKNGNTALMYACELGLNEMVILLIERGSNINIFNKNGNTALFIAIKNINNDIIKILINLSSNIDIFNKNGETALMIAIKKNNIIIVKYLIEFGANINIKNNSGQTPLILSMMYNYYEIFKILSEAGATFNLKNMNEIYSFKILNFFKKNLDLSNFEYIYLSLNENNLLKNSNKIINLDYSKYNFNNIVESIYRYIKSLPNVNLNNIELNKINNLNKYMIIQNLYSNFIFGYFTYIYYKNKENLDGRDINRLHRLNYIMNKKININELDFLIKNIYQNDSIMLNRFSIQYYIKNSTYIIPGNDSANNYLVNGSINPIKYKSIGLDYGGLLKQFFSSIETQLNEYNVYIKKKENIEREIDNLQKNLERRKEINYKQYQIKQYANSRKKQINAIKKKYNNILNIIKKYSENTINSLKYKEKKEINMLTENEKKEKITEIEEKYSKIFKVLKPKNSINNMKELLQIKYYIRRIINKKRYSILKKKKLYNNAIEKILSENLKITKDKLNKITYLKNKIEKTIEPNNLLLNNIILLKILKISKINKNPIYLINDNLKNIILKIIFRDFDKKYINIIIKLLNFETEDFFTKELLCNEVKQEVNQEVNQEVDQVNEEILKYCEDKKYYNDIIDFYICHFINFKLNVEEIIKKMIFSNNNNDESYINSKLDSIEKFKYLLRSLTNEELNIFNQHISGNFIEQNTYKIVLFKKNHLSHFASHTCFTTFDIYNIDTFLREYYDEDGTDRKKKNFIENLKDDINQKFTII